jgi:hypothetical protein
MAKRSKYSTALFEVITNARKPDKPLGRARGVMALATPKWWFKSRETLPLPAADVSPEPPPAPYDADDPTARVTAAALAARASIRTLVAAPATAAVAPWDAPVDAPAEPAAPTATACDDEEAELAARAFTAAVKAPEETRAPESRAVTGGGYTDAAPPSDGSGSSGFGRTEHSSFRSPDGAARPVVSRPGLKVALHPERQEVTLRLRYTSAIVGGFALLVAVGLAYVFGRRMAEGPPPARAAALSPSSADVRKGPAKPSVLNVGGARPASGKIAGVDKTGAGGPPPSRPPPTPEPIPTPPPAPESTVYFEAPVVNGRAKRQANLNYAAIVSFPAEMRERALAVRDFLTKNGITCTVESVPKVAGDKLVVVGVRGFAVRYSRLPEYSQYMETILSLGQQFAGKVAYDRFKPTMFKWE